MSSPPSHADLVNDALAVFDLLETQSLKSLGPTHRRDQLTRLVTDVCQRDGRPYEPAAIAQAVSAHLAAMPVPGSPGPRRAGGWWSSAARSAVQGHHRLVAWVKAACRWSPAARFWTGSAAASVLAALGLVFIPWITVAKAPFELAAHHGTLFSLLLLTSLGLSTAGTVYGFREDKSTIAVSSIVALVALILIGFSGALANVNANGTSDVTHFQNDLKAVSAAMLQARAKLKPAASLSDVVATANAALMADQSTRVRHVGSFDPETGVIRRKVELNPTECKRMERSLNSRFHIASVNEIPYRGGALSCPFTWDNAVVVEAQASSF